MTEALTLSGINALYGDSHVLHEVSCALNSGRVLALLGCPGIAALNREYLMLGGLNYPVRQMSPVLDRAEKR